VRLYLYMCVNTYKYVYVCIYMNTYYKHDSTQHMCIMLMPVSVRMRFCVRAWIYTHARVCEIFVCVYAHAYTVSRCMCAGFVAAGLTSRTYKRCAAFCKSFHTHINTHTRTHTHTHTHTCPHHCHTTRLCVLTDTTECYDGVAMISRLLEILGLFCRICSLL